MTTLRKICPNSWKSCDCRKGICNGVVEKLVEGLDNSPQGDYWSGVNETPGEAQPKPLTPLHCTQPANLRCWQCTQGWDIRITSRGISLARDYLSLRMVLLQKNISSDNLSKVEWAVHYLRQLINAQWRDMVRAPFNFPMKQTNIVEQNAAADYDSLFGEESLDVE